MATVDNLPGSWSYAYKPAPTFGADPSAWNARLVFYTDQSNLIPFVNVIAGQSESVTYSGGSTSRIVTLQHPVYNWMWSTGFSCEMFGEASEDSTELVDLHSKAKITVDFSSPTYPTSGTDPYLTWETKGSGLYATIPNRKMRFSTGEVLGQDAGEHFTQTTYILTLYQCPGMGDALFNLYNNKLNNATFRSIPAGQLRFDTWSASFAIGSGGVMQWTKQIQMTYQDHHWNQYYRSDGVLDTATDPASNPTYGSADFSLLLG